MADLRVVVLGAGVSGLATALLLARDGSAVTVVERDTFEVGAALDSPSWVRKGIPHFLQPHAFIPRGRAEMRRHLRDVYDELVAAGAHDVDLRPKLPGGAVEPADEELQYLGVRRPLIEWGLRRAVAREPRISVRAGARVDGIAVDRGRVTAARVDGAGFEADLLVDAMGRRTPLPAWLANAGVPLPEPLTSDCGVVYYNRYYRRRDGFDLPDGPFLLGPRGDLGYLAYATFPGDNRTFAATLATPTGTTDWRVLKDPPAFEAASALIPALRIWTDPAGVEPITAVEAMAGLRNSLRTPYGDSVGGLVAVGDAFCHTDPVMALGLSFGIIHAVSLAAALRSHRHVPDAVDAFVAEISPAAQERFALATSVDEQRLRMWSGGPVDLSPQGDYELFTVAAGGAAALVDPEVFRVFGRRIGLLDSTSVLDHDVALQARILRHFHALLARPRPPAGPPRDEMLAAAHAAATEASALA
ncbi:MAG: hypothetical protein QOJ60_595 [Actinomycetota bacterium]|nr:hypothetical protein [Actinomycetota bacterium]